MAKDLQIAQQLAEAWKARLETSLKDPDQNLLAGTSYTSRDLIRDWRAGALRPAHQRSAWQPAAGVRVFLGERAYAQTFTVAVQVEYPGGSFWTPAAIVAMPWAFTQTAQNSSRPTPSSGPPCPKCGGPTTLLFIHAVCDVCEPAK